MKSKKPWRERVPASVLAEVEGELYRSELRAALSWPTEADPEPVPFSWGDYDRLTGEPEEGTFWGIEGSDTEPRPRKVEITRDKYGWIHDGCPTGKRRGPLYRTEREAWLAAWWRACRRSARNLLEFERRIKEPV